MKYYVISGETSGDHHASRVMESLKIKDPSAKFRGMGGDQCQAAGLELVIHQQEMAVMGFVEILGSLIQILRNLRRIKKDILTWQPNAILLVDYPGFNLKIAAYGKARGIPIHYYISPKVWAWKEGRIQKLKQHIDRLYTILPFETPYFDLHLVNHTYVGNPSKESVDAYLQSNPIEIQKKYIALLPGSRKQEIIASLPRMLEAVKKYDMPLLVAQAPGFDAHFYHAFHPQLTLVQHDMYSVLAQSKAAIVTSGTATLETALMGVPQVVCYKTNRISYWIGKRVIKTKYISLVNLLLDKPCVKELIQDDFNANQLEQALDIILDPSHKTTIQNDYKELRKVLGNQKPSEELAHHIFHDLS